MTRIMTRTMADRWENFTTVKAMRWAFIAQAVLAVVLLSTDLAGRWDTDTFRSAPAPTGPVEPGDQVRRFDPARPLPQLADPELPPGMRLPANMPPRLTFDLQTHPDLGPVLMVHGAIDQNDATRLQDHLASLENVPPTLVINSPGGNVDTALALGQLIRDQALNTAILPGMACLSACPYMLAGGVERQVSLRAAVGLHQHYYETPGFMPVYFAVEDIQRSQGEAMRHLIAMGIDAGVMVYGLTTPPDDIYVLVEDELRDSRLATALTP